MAEPEVGVPYVEPPAVEASPSGGSLVDSIADLLRTFVAYLRQETGDLVRDKVVQPTQRAGATFALAIGVALVLVLGIAFVAVGALILLAQFIGWPAALFLVGGILILGAAGLAYARSRSMQR